LLRNNLIQHRAALILSLAAAMLSLSACDQPATQASFAYAPNVAIAGTIESTDAADREQLEEPLAGKFAAIKHVVIIFQENRTPDNLFNGFTSSTSVKIGRTIDGKTIPLMQASLSDPWDMDHSHGAFRTEYDHGKMDGFSQDPSGCRIPSACPQPAFRAYAYVPRADVEPYFDMASAYTFGDEMFQTNEGPSFPAHQYILSGTSTIANGSNLRAAENPLTPNHVNTGGCDAPKGSLVELIDPQGYENQHMYPCFDRLALTDLVNAKKDLTWRYYQAKPGAGLWEAPDAIKGIRYSQQFATNVVYPSATVLSDIAKGRLANVVWVTPTAAASDHAGITDGTGPSWVASIVNAIGESSYWKNTVIFVTWDDWGGWYDHVSPPQYNSYELGFRVPLIVISPYAKQHYVSHRMHEFGSILRFTEEAFDLGSLHTTDVRADDLSDCFDFGRPPTAFHPISAPKNAAYFLAHAIDNRDPDDDF
jgi:phospholipase C